MPPLNDGRNLFLYLILFLLLIVLSVLLRSKIRQATDWIILIVKRSLVFITAAISTFLQRIERKLLQSMVTRGDELYEELTPQDSADQDGVYDQQLKWALGKKNIRNIAITGPYGSGKSSVIKTFQKNHREYSYLNVSLAAFPENDKNSKEGEGAKNEGGGNAFVDGQLVEFSILQQIILHIHHSRLPGSRFHRIRHQKKRKTVVLAVCLILFLFTACYIFNPTFFNELVELLSWKNDTSWYNIIPYVFLLGLGTLIYTLLRIYSNSMISKFKIPAAELEVESKDVSVLNKQIEEILYFFEVTDFEVVVIEDLDRFDNPDIFTKLREINLLINNAQQVKRKITFLYVLGDHVFKGEQRTKFFDYIVPIIPIVNSTNSYQLLTDRITAAKLADKLPDRFIDEVSLYINDMRLLKNIMNEFNLYYAKLKKDKEGALDDTYLFALIMYKNMYPDDFALMHHRKGMVVEEFARKDIYIAQARQALANEIVELTKKIETAETSVAKDIDELRRIYLSKWMEMQSQHAVVAFQLGEVYHFMNTLLEDAVFNNMRSNTKLNYLYNQGSNNYYLTKGLSSVTFEKAEKKVDPDRTYDEKEEILQEKAKGQIDTWKKQIATNQIKITKLSNNSLRELIQEGIVEELSGRIKEHPLLVYFLRNGYINEDYPYYISHFYPGSLLVHEKDFVLNVKNRKNKALSVQLTNLPAVLKRLQLPDFETPTILNPDLVDYVLRNRTDKQQEATLLINQLASGQSYSNEFIDNFLLEERAANVFIQQLSPHYPGWWSYIKAHPTVTIDNKEKYYRLLLMYADVDALKAMDRKGDISDYLAILQYLGIPEEKLRHLLAELDVKISHSVDETLFTPSLVEHIYNNDLYTINQEMLTLIIGRLSKVQDILPAFTSRPYSTLYTTQLPKMIDYVNKDPDRFIEEVLLKSDQPVAEDEITITELFGREDISTGNKIEIIKKIILRISDIQHHPTDLWAALLQENKVNAKWNNVQAYFEHIGAMDDNLTGYLNDPDNIEELAKSGIRDSDTTVQMLQSLVNCGAISDLSFEQIVPSIPKQLAETDIASLPTRRLDLLVSHSLLPFDQTHFNHLKQKSRQLSDHFLMKNLEVLLSDLQNFGLEAKDYLTLLNAEELPKEQKLEFIPAIPPHLYEFSPLASVVAKFVVSENLSIPFINRLSLVQYSSDKELCVMLAIRQLQSEPNAIDQMLAVMGENYTNILQPDKRISFPASANNSTLFSLLRSNGYITRISHKDDVITVYTRKQEQPESGG